MNNSATNNFADASRVSTESADERRQGAGMSQEGHTPGPWSVCGEGKCSCKTIMCADHPIAVVTHGTWGDDYPAVRLVGTSSLDQKAEAYMEQITYGEVGESTARANALLIAAAPDLLEACNAARIVIKGRDQDQREAAVLDLLKVAIAKATVRG